MMMITEKERRTPCISQRLLGAFMGVLPFWLSFQHNKKNLGKYSYEFSSNSLCGFVFHFGYVIIFLYNTPSSLYGF